MYLYVCVDDRGGMLFHGRRLSLDRAVRSDLLADAGGREVWMSPYSAGQFRPEDPVMASEDFLERCPPGACCFVEDRSLRPWLARAEGITLYRWNRTYPFDLRLDVDPAAEGWSLTERRDFPGHSHPVITKEVYRP